LNQGELPAVAALRSLSIFHADQAGAFREHFGELASVLGTDISTKLALHLEQWGRSDASGLRVLTGNAGTGKTAAAEAYCRATGGRLPAPDEDGLIEVAPSRWVAKDLSGLPNAAARAEELRQALDLASQAQVLLCANEGVLRDAVAALGEEAAGFRQALEDALRAGAAADPDASSGADPIRARMLVINVNRQRPTAPALWDALLDFVSREELWHGCEGCPWELRSCPMRANAAALRTPEVRGGLRMLVQLGAGEAVPTLREVLAILAWGLTNELSCDKVQRKVRDQGAAAFTAQHGYFSLALGDNLPPEAVERSPLLMGMRASGLGDTADLEVDDWLRDSTAAPPSIQVLAAAPGFRIGENQPEEPSQPSPTGSLNESSSPLDRVSTLVGTMTFYRLGEMISTSEDADKVEAGLDALVGRPQPAYQALWRRRVFFEAPDAVGGLDPAANRLLGARFFPDLLHLAAKVSAGVDTVLELLELVKGLNFLVTGFSSADEGLVIPDPSSLFARDPGAFRPARPSLVHSQVQRERLGLRVPDRGLVEQVLDVDHIEVELVVDGNDDLALQIRPRMYEAIREAASFQGPVGQGIAEMTDLRNFYGRLASSEPAAEDLRVADPDALRPVLIPIGLPYFGHD
jgi:hypothetical protein